MLQSASRQSKLLNKANSNGVLLLLYALHGRVFLSLTPDRQIVPVLVYQGKMLQLAVHPDQRREVSDLDLVGRDRVAPTAARGNGAQRKKEREKRGSMLFVLKKRYINIRLCTTGL